MRVNERDIGTQAMQNEGGRRSRLLSAMHLFFELGGRDRTKWFLSTITLCAAVAAMAMHRPPPASAAVSNHEAEGKMWDTKALGKAPATTPAVGLEVQGVTSLFYDGLPYQGKPTRVFAYVGIPNVSKGTRVPAMVLVHGGGGTAFDSWVRLWTSRGYAAIAMDLCGCVPKGTYGNWRRHPEGGPPGWGGFDQIDQPEHDQWTYHAVADILLAHSLLRSYPEIDPKRIGITGISWGGYLTCIVSGIDKRFRFAVPVYGCGYLGEDSVWLPDFENMGQSKAQKWLHQWDPSVYLKESTMPMLWVDGTNDFAYPPDSLQRSYRLPRGARAVCMRVRMPHGHGGPGENPEEIHAYADTYCLAGVPMAHITAEGNAGNHVWATYRSRNPIVKAELNFTTDAGKWQDRKWSTLPATVDIKHHRVSADLPDGVRVYYLNLIDSRDLIVSTEHVEMSHTAH